MFFELLAEGCITRAPDSIVILASLIYLKNIVMQIVFLIKPYMREFIAITVDMFCLNILI